jgi:hypothetical protein
MTENRRKIVYALFETEHVKYTSKELLNTHVAVALRPYSLLPSLQTIDCCDSSLWFWSLLLGNLPVRLVAASDLLAPPFWSRGQW